MLPVEIKKDETEIAKILHYLISEYGSLLNDLSVESFPEVFHRKTGITSKSVQNWLKRETKRVNRNASTKLAEFFKPIHQDIEPEWFRSGTFETFVQHLDKPTSHYLNFQIPTEVAPFEAGAFEEMRNELAGIYHSYRYAFYNTNEIAKEMLHIKWDNGKLVFTYYFLTDGVILSELNGIVLPIGENYVFFGIYLSKTPRNHRFRTLVIKRQGEDKRFTRKRFGILLGSHASSLEPSAAKVLLVHDEKKYSDIKILAKKEVKFIDQNVLQSKFPKHYKLIVDSVVSNKVSMQSNDKILTLDTIHFDTLLRDLNK